MATHRAWLLDERAWLQSQAPPRSRGRPRSLSMASNILRSSLPGLHPPPTDQTARPAKARRIMGPGLITGASDDDPSGIAPYSQAGAQLGYSLGWTLLLTYPLMCAIQMISAQVGRVTGKGLAGNMRRHYPALVIYPLIALCSLPMSSISGLISERWPRHCGFLSTGRSWFCRGVRHRNCSGRHSLRRCLCRLERV